MPQYKRSNIGGRQKGHSQQNENVIDKKMYEPLHYTTSDVGEEMSRNCATDASWMHQKTADAFKESGCIYARWMHPSHPWLHLVNTAHSEYPCERRKNAEHTSCPVRRHTTSSSCRCALLPIGPPLLCDAE